MLVPTQIIFEYNDQEKKAAGVEYLYNGQKHKVLVNREVILSAGAVSSPHILMLSGIGHKDKLEKFSIQAVHHLPAVGQHLKDHLGLHCRYSVNETIGFDFEKYSSVPGFLQMGFEYYFKSSGDQIGFTKSLVAEFSLQFNIKARSPCQL